jgi:hypothetical protein
MWAPAFFKTIGLVLMIAGAGMGANFFLSVLATEQQPRQHGPATVQASHIPTLAPLDEARQIIPKNLRIIYAALNQGNPTSASAMVSQQLIRNYAKLDTICRPFTYRAHYIESIIERAEGKFEARVHVLLGPMDEQMYVLIFGTPSTQFELEDVGTVDDDWIGSEKQAAADLARNFVFAAKAHRADELARIVAPGIKTDLYISDPCWDQFFYDSQDVRISGTELKSYKGMKMEVDVDLSPAGGFGYRDVGQAHFLVEKLGRAYKIVAADPRGDYVHFWHPADVCQNPAVLEKQEDPEIEKRTLKRFSLIADRDAESMQ